MATGQAGALDFNTLCVLAAEVTARASANAVRAASALRVGDLWLPAARDLAG